MDNKLSLTLFDMATEHENSTPIIIKAYSHTGIILTPLVLEPVRSHKVKPQLGVKTSFAILYSVSHRVPHKYGGQLEGLV